MDPRVSVVIPCYNRARHIEKAIDSVFGQTTGNVEIILVDDGSTDNTRDIIAGKYGDRVRYIYQENQGIPGARNTGIRQARGEYVAFLDSDDYWRPNKLERQLALFEAHPEYGMVACRCDKIQCAENPKKPNRPLSYQGRRGKSGWVLKDLFVKNFIRTSSVIIRRNCFEKVGLFDETLLQTQDYDLWLRMAAAYPVGFINEPLTVYLDNAKGISTDSLLGRLYRQRALEKEYLKKELPKKLYRRRMAQTANVIGRHYIRRGDREKGLTYLKHSLRLQPFSIKYIFYFIRGLFARQTTSVVYDL